MVELTTRRVLTDVSPVLRYYFQVIEDRPGKQRRRQQVQYLLTCYEGLCNRLPVVIEGPTGSGKTLGLITAILPLLLDANQGGENIRVIYCSRTINQLRLFMRELKSCLIDIGRIDEIPATLVIGRSSSRKYACLGLEEDSEGWGCNCKNRGRHYVDIPFFYDLDEYKKDFERGYCPYLTARYKCAPQARVVACTYTYLLSERERLRILGSEKNRRNAILLVDEAHNFLHEVSEDPVATLYFSSKDKINDQQRKLNNPAMNRYFLTSMLQRSREVDESFASGFKEIFLKASEYEEILEDIQDAILPVYESFAHQERKILLYGRKLFSFIEEIDRRISDSREKGLKGLQEYMSSTLDTLENEHGSVIDELLHLYELIKTLVRAKSWGYYAFLGTTEDPDINMCDIYSIHPAQRVGDILRGLRGAVFTSATLSPPDKIGALLGIKKGLYFKVGSPFSSRNYRSYFLAGVHSGIKDPKNLDRPRIDGFEHKIIRETLSIAFTTTPGGVGVYANSRAVASAVLRDLRSACHGSGRKLLIGDPSDVIDYDERRSDDYLYLASTYGKELSRIELFEEIGRHPGHPVVLLSITGGRFGEGVDFPGHMMDTAVILGVPFPGFGAERAVSDIKIGYYYFLTGDPILSECFAYRYEAIRKVAQTAGRVHRRKEDQGVIIFIDERMLGIKHVYDADGEPDYEDRKQSLDEANAILQSQILEKRKIVLPTDVVEDLKNVPLVLMEHELVNHIKRFIPESKVIPLWVMKREMEEFFAERKILPATE